MFSDVLCSLMKNYTEQVVKWQVTLCDPIWHVSSRSGELLYPYIRHLRSSTDRSCVVPRTYNTFGDRSFAVAGPHVWNSLPGHLRDEYITYSSFRRELKTYWFSCNRGAM